MDDSQIQDLVDSDDVAELEDFTIKNNTLYCNTELNWDNHAAFRTACQKLLHENHESIVVDISSVDFIFSAYLGTFGSLIAEATELERHVTIRISKTIKWLFEMIRMDSIVTLEVHS